MPPPKATAKHGSLRQALKYRSPKTQKNQKAQKSPKAETQKGSNKILFFLNAFPHGVAYATPESYRQIRKLTASTKNIAVLKAKKKTPTAKKNPKSPNPI